MRYGLTTNALTSSTIATAPTIVTTQSIVTRHESGRPRVSRSTGLRECRTGRGAGGGASLPGRRVRERILRLGRQRRPAEVVAAVGADRRRRRPAVGGAAARGELCPAPARRRRERARLQAPRRAPAQRLLGRGRVLVRDRERRLRAVLRPVVDVAHAVLRERLCSARQPSIRAWFPERSTSGTSQPENSAGRV